MEACDPVIGTQSEKDFALSIHRLLPHREIKDGVWIDFRSPIPLISDHSSPLDKDETFTEKRGKEKGVEGDDGGSQDMVN